jgi:uncharacterized protein (TIGR00369 family)
MTKLNPAYVDALIKTVNSSPFPRHISMRLIAVETDHAEMELDSGPNHMQPFGIVHGGAIASLIDTTTFWSAFMRVEEDCGMVNIDLKLNYLQAVTDGTLYAAGRCIRAGRSISYTEASIRNGAGELVAHGTSTLMALPGKGLNLGVPKFL